MNFTPQQLQIIIKKLQELKDIPGVKQLFVCFEFTDNQQATTVHSNPFDMNSDSGLMLTAILKILDMAYRDTEYNIVHESKPKDNEK